LDQRHIDAGVAPKVPEVPDNYKGQAIASPVIPQARHSSDLINSNHSNTVQSDEYSKDRDMIKSEHSNPTYAPAPLDITKASARASRDLDGSSRKQRLSMDKPLPRPPQQPALSEDPALGQFLPKHQNYVVKDAPATPSLKGIVDLGNTVDTDVTETWAPGMFGNHLMGGL
jgi:hypothetical protein